MHMCKLLIQILSTYVGGANATNLGFIKLVQTLLHMVNMLGQATWIQLNLFHIFVEVVKKGEIESPSLVLTN